MKPTTGPDPGALNTSIMAEKWAKIPHTAISAGRPRYFTAEEATAIDVRPDEHYRRVQLLNSSGEDQTVKGAS